LPLRASEAAALAEVLFQQLDKRGLSEEQRQRIAARTAAIKLETVRPYWGSLAQDPVHSSSYYLAVDGLAGGEARPLLLRIALASSPASGLFPKALLIGRMRPGGGREVVVSATAFGAGDAEAIQTFATQVDKDFLPRPQGSQSAITVDGANAEAGFEAFRRLHRATGHNYASIRGDLAAGQWAAIRAGWRMGFLDGGGGIVPGDDLLERLQQMKSGASAVQWLIVPVERAGELAPLARQYGTVLSFAGGELMSEETLRGIGAATGGKCNIQVAGKVEADRLVWIAEQLRG
jgi:hypothetical protein